MRLDHPSKQIADCKDTQAVRLGLGRAPLSAILYLRFGSKALKDWFMQKVSGVACGAPASGEAQEGAGKRKTR